MQCLCLWKRHRSPIPHQRTSRKGKGLPDLIHSDVCGPFETQLIGGSRYFISIIDACSNWVSIYMMSRKSDAMECLKHYEKMAERNTGRKIRVFRSDRGGEYMSNELKVHFADRGIKHELTSSSTTQQNGVAERLNWTLLDFMRSILCHKGLPKALWVEALSTAVYIRNRVTGRALRSNTTPFYLWTNQVPMLSHVRVPGSKCWYVLPKRHVQKLHSCSRQALFIGYCDISKAYKLLDGERKSIVISRDVIFDESTIRKFGKDFGNSISTNDNTDDDYITLDLEQSADNCSRVEPVVEFSGNLRERESSGSPDIPTPQQTEVETDDSGRDIEPNITEQNTTAPVRRSNRQRRHPGSW